LIEGRKEIEIHAFEDYSDRNSDEDSRQENNNNIENFLNKKRIK